MNASNISSKFTSTVKNDRDRYIAFAFAAAHLFLEIDRSGMITYASGASSALKRGESNKLHGERFIQYVAPIDRDYFKEILTNLFIHNRIDPRPLRLRTASNREITLMMGGFIMPDAPNAIHLSFNILPKTSAGNIRKGEDEDTGLLDKKAFDKAAIEQLETNDRMGRDSKLTLFVIDGLVELKNSTDPFVIARALDKIASYLRAISLDGSTAGQLDAEKFGIMHSSNITEEEVKKRISEIIAEELDGAAEVKSFSIDFEPGELEEEDAAKALSYSLKKFVDSRAEDFSITSLQSSAKEMMKDTLSRISEVREIIEQRNFDVVYQPIVDLYMEEPHHLEALTRVTGLASPQAFIKFTEEVGLIEDFDLALTQKVLDDLDNHSKMGWNPKIAINVSAKSMESSIFIDGFNSVLEPYKHLSKQLMLELTETVAVSDFVALNRVLQSFRKEGIEVCLDDVGAGSTSFQSLYELQVDYLKIDGKFVREAAENPRDMAMLKSIIKNGKELGCKLIAEQIEDPDQARLMESLDIDYGQGYLYGRPTLDHSLLRPNHKSYKSKTPKANKEAPAAKAKPKHHISMNLKREK